MSIDEIKDIRKLQKMLKYERELRKYTYACCEEAGKELEKNSFAWEGKEKNLVIQAMDLNERYDKLKQTLAEIKEIAEKAKKDICNNCAWRNTDSCAPEDYICGELINILQKIREVEK